MFNSLETSVGQELSAYFRNEILSHLAMKRVLKSL
jgi:hypothetical protein